MLATVEILSTPLVGPELAEQAEAAFSTAHPTPQSRPAAARSQGAQS